MDIPKIVTDTALKHGYDYIEYLGKYGKADVYSVGVNTDDEFPCPTGLPSCILFEQGEAKLVFGTDSLKILNSFDEPFSE